MSPDVAAVVNLHREGPSATASIISAWRAVERARTEGVTAALVLLLDDPDRETTAVAETWRARGARIVAVNKGDLGAARNEAARKIESEWIAFLDADDLWGEHWLSKAFAAGASTDGSDATVWHPAVNIIFGDHHSLLHHVASDDPTFSWSRFRMHNVWTALCFVRRQTLLQLPYPRNDLDAGFGYEDWAWNMTVLEHGGTHRVVADTCHFVRRTDGDSLLSRSQTALRSRPDRHGLPPWRSSAAERPSKSLPEAHDPHTHTVGPVELSDGIRDQVRLATTIAPDIAGTVVAHGMPVELPQNTQTHFTASHLALEELNLKAAADVQLEHRAADILESSTRLTKLSGVDRARVVAEFVIEERRIGRSIGSSQLLDDAYDHFPQANA